MNILTTKRTGLKFRTGYFYFLFLVSINLLLYGFQTEVFAQTRVTLISSNSGFVENTEGNVKVVSVAGYPLSGSGGASGIFLSGGLAAYISGQELISAVKNVDGLAPTVFSLSQNYPNPFNPTTTLQFSVPKNGRAALIIYNIIGQKVATLFDQVAETGKYYRVQFDASRMASGVYFARLKFGDNVLLKKMLMLK